MKLQLVHATAKSFGRFSTLYSVRRVVWTLTCTRLTSLQRSLKTKWRPCVLSLLYDVPFRTTSTLEHFTPVTIEEVNKLTGSVPCRTCQLYPVPTWLVKKIRVLNSPSAWLLMNKSLADGCFAVSLLLPPSYLLSSYSALAPSLHHFTVPRGQQDQ